MKIGIDARLINETGVGRYIRNLMKNWARWMIKIICHFFKGRRI